MEGEMGGRGSSSGMYTGRGGGVGSGYIGGARQTNAGGAGNIQAAQNSTLPPQGQTAQQQPTQPAFTPQAPMPATLAQFSNMSDNQMAQVLRAANGIDMPNHLKDAPDGTQELVYTIGLNDPPQTMDTQQFNQFMRANGIRQSEILARSVNNGTYTTTAGSQRQLTPQMINNMFVSDPYNYIGGKHGGQAIGAGTYFDMNGGRNTGYGGTTMRAVLNPTTARVVDINTLRQQIPRWAANHPKADREIRRLANKSNSWGNGQYSLYALAMGYNVIRGNSYHNVIDRSALVVEI